MKSARTLLPLVLLASPLAAQKTEPPPGMVRIDGNRVTVGTDWKVLKTHIEEDELLLGPLAPEHPSHRVKVEDFFLGLTEVTNEQYAAFVSATGHRPPRHWAPEDKVDAAARAFLEEQGRMREEAKKAGEPVPERKKFDRVDWFSKNWQEAGWEIPDGLEKHPVVWVSYQDASAYARWAGLRLMSEAEFQLACRGKGEAFYPWGEEWEPERCVFRDTPGNQNLPFPVGSAPAGANEAGVVDLIGNVWEWTSTPFTAYEGWKPEKMKFGGRREKIATVEWDANARVAVGGSFQNAGLAMRCTTRRPIERFQTTEGMGFRCAASLVPGQDVAEAVMREDLPVERRPSGLTYAIDQATGADRWESSPGAEVDGPNGYQVPENYAVITSYEALLYIPVEKIDLATVKALGKLSLEQGPQHLGVLSTTRDAVSPVLPKGTYMLAYRGAGDDPEPEPVEGEDEAAAAPVFEYPEGLDKEVDNLLFLAPAGQAVAFLPIDVTYARQQQPRVEIGASTYPVVEVDEDGEETVTNVPCDRAMFVITTPGPGRNGFNYEIPLCFERGTLGEGWRTR